MHPVLWLPGLRNQRKEVLYGAQSVQLEVRKQLGQRALRFGFAQQLLPHWQPGGAWWGGGHHGCGVANVRIAGKQVCRDTVSLP